jgi:hypothetical protein
LVIVTRLILSPGFFAAGAAFFAATGLGFCAAGRDAAGLGALRCVLLRFAGLRFINLTHLLLLFFCFFEKCNKPPRAEHNRVVRNGFFTANKKRYRLAFLSYIGILLERFKFVVRNMFCFLAEYAIFHAPPPLITAQTTTPTITAPSIKPRKVNPPAPFLVNIVSLRFLCFILIPRFF